LSKTIKLHNWTDFISLSVAPEILSNGTSHSFNVAEFISLKFKAVWLTFKLVQAIQNFNFYFVGMTFKTVFYKSKKSQAI